MQAPVKVLAIDDIDENLSLLEDCLAGLELELVLARTGEEGLELFDAGEYALVLLDVKMPGIDGFETATRMRERERLEKRKPTPILFVTCSISEYGNASKAYALDAIDFLFKPFDPRVMRTKVGVLADLYRQRRQIEQQAERLALSEEALRKQTIILDSILGSMGDGVIVVDEKGEFLIFNPAAVAMIGREVVTCPQEEWAERFALYHADKRTLYDSDELPLARALRGESTDNVEMFLPNPKVQGGVLVRCSGRPVRDGRGSLIGGVVTFHDVTEQKRAHALKEGQRRMLEQLARGEQLHDALDSFVRIVEEQSSEMFCSVLVMSGDGKHLLHGAAPSLPAEYTRAIDGIEIGSSVGSCGTAAYKRERIIVSDIETDPLWTNFCELAQAHNLRACWSQPIIAADGELLGTFAIYYQHSQGATQNDLQLIEAAAAIVGIAIKRARAEERLQSYARRLARSNHELQDFVNVASHDLQEPLRKIRAFGDRLKQKANGSLGADSLDYIERMSSAATRMQTLIGNLLEFSRVQTKGHPFVKVDLDRVAREVVSDLEIRIEQTGGRVELGELGEIEADASQMRQLLQNLIGNALKFHKKGQPPVVKVRGARLRERRAAVRDAVVASAPMHQIFVEDNGIGFDEQHLERIFSVFQRLHSRSEFEGTGIGLAICRRIAERHHGQITAHSSPSEGATFVVTLPVVQPAE